MSLKDIEKLTKAIIEGNSLGIPLHQFLHNIPIGNILNHFKMGFATHLFGKTFVSRKRIPYCLTTAAIYAGAMMPSKIKTMLLQKAL